MVGLEGAPVADKIDSSDHPFVRIVSLPASNRRSFTWKRVDSTLETDKDNFIACASVNQAVQDKNHDLKQYLEVRS